jgi:nicotinate-nucleotide pyrophosphorylase (carboxylating)
MDNDELRTAVKLVDGRAKLEASGGYRLDNVRAAAETGVDFISMGSLTHGAPALDLSMVIDGE